MGVSGGFRFLVGLGFIGFHGVSRFRGYKGLQGLGFFSVYGVSGFRGL